MQFGFVGERVGVYVGGLWVQRLVHQLGDVVAHRGQLGDVVFG